MKIIVFHLTPTSLYGYDHADAFDRKKKKGTWVDFSWRTHPVNWEEKSHIYGNIPSFHPFFIYF